MENRLLSVAANWQTVETGCRRPQPSLQRKCLDDLGLAILAVAQIHVAPAKLVLACGNVDKRLVIVIAQYG